MAKIIIETEDISEARAVLDAIETRSAAPVATPEPPTATQETREPDAAPEAAPVSDDETDSIGMPYNPAYHTTTKTKNADGTWKALRGHADEAKAAAAAFKAAGGNVAPPADLPAPTADVQTPLEPVAGGIPMGAAMPTAAPAAPAVDQAKIEEKIGGMITRGKLVNDVAGNHEVGNAPEGTFQNLLDRFGIDRVDPVTALANDDGLRAQVYAACCEIEPEAP